MKAHDRTRRFALCAVTVSAVFWCGVCARGDVVGTETFSYGDGTTIGGQVGGTGWNYEQNDEAGAPAPLQADWNNTAGAPTVQGGKLVTSDSGAKREYCGLTEGSGFPSNEREGAFRGVGALYFSTLLTRRTGASWSGVSSFDFGAEKIFYGRTGSGANLSIGESGVGTSSGPYLVEEEREYRLVGALDFDNDILKIWLNPSQNHEAAPRVTRAYTFGNWASALRLASGAGANTEWDDLVVASSWADLGLPAQVDDLYGRDGFAYTAGDISGQTGGTGWSWNNETLTNTMTQSDWDTAFGTANTERGLLVTDGAGAYREYNGPTEGSAAGQDEQTGALRGVGRIYFSFLLNRDEAAPWSGLSAFDFGAEKLFFGVPGGAAVFGINESGTTNQSLTSVSVVNDRTYRVVGCQDYDNDRARIWINPTVADENAPDAELTFTWGNWSSKLRLASGASGRVEWDDVKIAAIWEDLGLPEAASAGDLLAYEPFESYTVGNLPGQDYEGTHFMAGGSWWGDGVDASTVVTNGGLTYGHLFETGGKATTKGNGGVGSWAEPAILPGGVFYDAGVVDTTSGDVGGGTLETTVYYSFLARSTTGTGSSAYAGLHLYRDDAEILLVGNNWASGAFSVGGGVPNADLNSFNHDSGQVWQSIDTATHLFVVRVDFHAGADDDCTVWLDPDIAFSEAGQNAAARTILPQGNYAFDRIHLRSGNGANAWDFDEIRVGTTWTAVVPNDYTGTLFIIR